MKYLRFYMFFIVFLLMLSYYTCTTTAYSKELPDSKSQHGYVLQKGINYNTPNPYAQFYNVKKGNSLQGASVTFNIIDSLANAYSYYTAQQQPFIYNKDVNTLVTIMRGYVDLANDPSYAGTNTKDNLFILQSKDWGTTWTAPELVFNAKTTPPSSGLWGAARYPSIYSLIYPDSIAFMITTPTTNETQGVWQGFVNGIFYQHQFAPSFSADNITISGQGYGWAGTDSKVIAGLIGTDPYGLAIGGLIAAGGTSHDLNSNIAYRRSTDFTTWDVVVPPSWATTLFNVPTADSGRSAVITGINFSNPNKIIMGAEGNFLGASDNNRFKPAVSYSTDNGVSWSDFNICPFSLIRDYATAAGYDPDSVSVGVSSFTVFDNDDVSFAGQLIDQAQNGVTVTDILNNAVEVYMEGGTWGIRKISDITTFLNFGTNNQLGFEIQITRTVDGKGLVAKWVNTVKPADPALSNYNTTDIFINARQKSSSKWGNPTNITNSDIIDRVTWVPDMVPSDFKNCPILKVMTVPNSTDDVPTAFSRQTVLDVQPQYVMMGHFDASIALGVDDNNASTLPLQINSISPNPSDNSIEVTFNSSVNGNVKIELYDIMGQLVKNIYDGTTSIGMHSLNSNVAGLPSGAYCCTITSNGQKATKLITVIH